MRFFNKIFLVLPTCLLTVFVLKTIALAELNPVGVEVLASVNSVDITTQDLTWEIEQLKNEMRLRNRPLSQEQIQALRGQLVENLIERELLYQQAQQRKLKIRPRWIELALHEFKQQFVNQSDYSDFISQSGLSETLLKERIGKGLVVRRLLRREVIRGIKVSEAEMQAFFRQFPEFFKREEQVRARHILIAIGDDMDKGQIEDAMLRMMALQLRIQEGANFGAMALEYSDCPSKARAGDLGYFTREQMVPSFATVAFGLKPGEVSEIVITPFGYHLIQVLDRNAPSQMAYRDSRDKIERTLRRDKENTAVVGYVKKLKSRADVTRFGLQQ